MPVLIKVSQNNNDQSASMAKASAITTTSNRTAPCSRHATKTTSACMPGATTHTPSESVTKEDWTRKAIPPIHVPQPRNEPSSSSSEHWRRTIPMQPSRDTANYPMSPKPVPASLQVRNMLTWTSNDWKTVLFNRWCKEFLRNYVTALQITTEPFFLLPHVIYLIIGVKSGVKIMLT